MAAGPQLVAFIASTDLERSHAFYAGVLGLKRVEATSFANEYDAHGTPLRVAAVGEHTPAAFTVLGWRVSDIRSALSELGAHGVEFKRYAALEQDDDGVWTAPGGTKIAWFEDPDGNVLSVGEPAR
jgi:catechol 2,3-dioxygenase-like lactoylglutathione lyase family enzyme